MIKRSATKAASRAPLIALPETALVHVTGGSAPSIDETRPVVWMREIVHVQARK